MTIGKALVLSGVLFAAVSIYPVADGRMRLSKNEPARVLVVSLMDSAELEVFFQYLEIFDSGRLINLKSRPSTADEADVVVYFFDRWSDAKIAPGADEMDGLFEYYADMDRHVYASATRVKDNTGRSVLIIAYSTHASEYRSMLCYAAITVRYLKSQKFSMSSPSCQ